MENLQKLMPYFQDQLAQWYQLTLEKPEYAAAIAVSVWLLLAILYSIRIAFLKKDIGRLTKSNADAQAKLTETENQVEAARQELDDANRQLQNAEQVTESEKRRAEAAEQQLVASNQELAGSLANLAESFELTLQNMPSADSGNLISEYQSVVARVSERFKNEQQAKTQLQLSFHAESAKLAEKEMLITSLQHRLDSQTQQLAQMELAIEQYEAAQRQLQADREQQIADAMAKQQAQVEATKLAEAKTKAQEAKFAQAAVGATLQKSEQSPTTEKPAENAIEAAPVIPTPKAEAVKTVEMDKKAAGDSGKEAAIEKKAKASDSGKFKGLFGRAMEKFAKMDEKLNSSTEAKSKSESQPAAEEAKAAEPEPVEVEAVQPEPKEKPKKPSDVASKMTGLFGGFKKSKAKESAASEPVEIAENPREEPQSEPEKTATTEETGKSGKKIPSQLSGLFGKLKKK